ncbi:exodeoxyribonuclease V subunit alpha [Zobellella aerophila]|uniref:RecBCD enzyme subunit RecD n=1 Tax=Zobellella aerophila TaxID=870480 RepID=A0ABP6WIE0_9GAMM
MRKRLAELVTDRELRPIDAQFALFIGSYDANPAVVLAAALVSRALGHGHVCLPLDRLAQMTRDAPGLTAWLGELPSLTGSLVSSPVVGPGAPLRLELGRLYLARYWQYEQTVAGWLLQPNSAPRPEVGEPLNSLFARDYRGLFQRLAQVRGPGFDGRSWLADQLDIVRSASLDWPAILTLLLAADNDQVLHELDRLVPESACLNWQKQAVATALAGRFAVISGGPGTGKTTTVTRLLGLLVSTADRPPLIRLVAPTGKAAARLSESIGAARHSLDLPPEVIAAIPDQAGTLHRLLGVIPGRRRFRHHRDNPLHLDVLVVDEASMVDLPLMACLLDALPPHARLILLGDRDQLASVEAGAVLGDICAFAEQGISPKHGWWLQRVTGQDLSAWMTAEGSPLRDQLCLLRKSYRFDAGSGIGRLAAAVNGGQVAVLRQTLAMDFQDIAQHGLAGEGYGQLLHLCLQGYRPYLEAIRAGRPPVEVLKLFGRFQLLVALREGPLGVAGLNEAIVAGLVKQGLIGRQEWFAGRPVMVMENDHAQGLYNGDIGIVLADAAGELRVWFQLPDGALKGFRPSRLPAHETVYAMTIHKSQGSEFAHTVLVLPTELNPILTRELVYTGITRAKSRLDLFVEPGILERAIVRRIERASGLQARLALPR